jgi:hypothetical protein
MHWVVCKTQEEEIEREFPSKLERGMRAAKRAHFSRDFGHKSQGGFYVLWVLNFMLLERPYCADPYSPYNMLGGHENRGNLLHGFQGSHFSVFCWRRRQFCCCPYNRYFGTNFEVLERENTYNCMDFLGTKIEANFGTVLVL